MNDQGTSDTAANQPASESHPGAMSPLDIEHLVQEQVRRLLQTPSVTQSQDTVPGPSQMANENVASLTFKLTPLVSQDPKVWFHIIESQLAIGRITSESTRYNHLLGALNERVIADVSDIIIGPRSATPYTDLKNAILERLGDSKQTQINRLLQGLELGDLKPSQLLRRMKTNGGANVDDEFVKMIWLKRLPPRAQEILTPTAEALNTTKLAELADRLMETMSQNHVMPLSTNTQSNQVESSLAVQLNEITRRLDQMEHSDFRNSSRSHSRHRSRTPGKHNNKQISTAPKDSVPSECYCHKRFKDEARNCKPNCSRWSEFKAKN